MTARKGRTARWDAMIDRIGVVSHHLQSLLGAIKLTVLRVFVCKVEDFEYFFRDGEEEMMRECKLFS
jgi:hypothetical protein